MQCLNCGAEMHHTVISTPDAQAEYDSCDKCGGLWLDTGQLRKLAYQVTGDIEYCSTEAVEGAAPQVLKCPRCDNADLYRVRFLDATDIILQRCENCAGFWLGPGELQQINKELSEDGPVAGHGLSDFINEVHLPHWVHRTQTAGGEARPPIEAPPIHLAKLVRDTSAACPSCGAKLSEYHLGMVHFEGCNACKGIWLHLHQLRELKNKADEGTLRWLNADVDQLERSTATPTSRPCPHCAGAKLVATHFGQSKLVVDWCPDCRGLWLDRDQFQHITEFLVERRNAAHAGDVATQLRRDWRDLWSGGPEPRADDLENLAADLHGLLHVAIFDHPKLAQLLVNTSGQAYRSGLGG